MKDDKLNLQQVLAAGNCDAKFDNTGRMLFVCCNVHQSKALNVQNLEDSISDFESDSSKGFSCIAIHPLKSEVSFGGDDGTVYTFDASPSFQLNGYATKQSLPVNHITYSSTGSFMFVACDEPFVRVISLANKSLISKLFHEKNTAGPSARSLAADPMGDYLAASFFDGSIHLFSVENSSRVHVWRNVTGKQYVSDQQFTRMCWTADGQNLIIPGGKDVAVYRRDQWDKPAKVLKGHGKDSTIAAVNRSGKLVATTGSDLQVLIWDLEKAETLEKVRLPTACSSLHWDPEGKHLAISTVIGQVGIWKDVIPDHLAATLGTVSAKPSMPLSMNTGSPAKKSKKMENTVQNRRSLFVEDEADEDDVDDGAPANDDYDLGDYDDLLANDDDDDDEGVDAHLNGQPLSAKNWSEKAVAHDDEEDGNVSRSRNKKKGADAGHYRAPTSMREPQPAFQSSATPMKDKQACLCWNTYGRIVSTDEDSQFGIEIEFLEGSDRRPLKFKEHFGYTMAAMDSNGAVLACTKSKDHPSVVVYKPFDTWAPQSDWVHAFRRPEENVEAVACGRKFVAVATDAFVVRLFSVGGIQEGIFSIPGPIVTMSGQGDLLAIVYHNGPVFQGHQHLECLVMDIAKQREISRRPLPISPRSILTWLGFSESGLLCAFDSVGLLRVLLPEWDYQWQPLFDSRLMEKKNRIWPVSIADNAIICVFLREQSEFPPVNPRPFVQEVDFAVPVVQSEKNSSVDEEQVLLKTCFVNQLRRAAEFATDEQEKTIANAIIKLEIEIDSALLKIVQAACKNERSIRALDAANRMVLRRTLDGAVKLAQFHKLSVLANRIHYVLQSKFKDDASHAEVTAPYEGFLDRRLLEITDLCDQTEAVRAETVGQLKWVSEQRDVIQSMMGKLKEYVIEEEEEERPKTIHMLGKIPKKKAAGAPGFRIRKVSKSKSDMITAALDEDDDTLDMDSIIRKKKPAKRSVKSPSRAPKTSNSDEAKVLDSHDGNKDVDEHADAGTTSPYSRQHPEKTSDNEGMADFDDIAEEGDALQILEQLAKAEQKTDATVDKKKSKPKKRVAVPEPVAEEDERTPVEASPPKKAKSSSNPFVKVSPSSLKVTDHGDIFGALNEVKKADVTPHASVEKKGSSTVSKLLSKQSVLAFSK
eukprot:ANDGO_02456.mRNA.1 Minichromosome loss protein 1